jgi:hypothetical protein
MTRPPTEAGSGEGFWAGPLARDRNGVPPQDRSVNALRTIIVKSYGVLILSNFAN